MVIGTLSGARTTPEAPEFQRHLADAVAAGVDLVAVEVSSHALDQGRVDGTRFAVGVFTNLSHDHLDYHGSMEAYFEAKARLFHEGRCQSAVVCTDDEAGRRLAERIRQAGTPELVPYSVVDATNSHSQRNHSSFELNGFGVTIAMPGLHNVANAVGAAVAGHQLGLSHDTIAAGLRQAPPIRGRFEVVDQDHAVTVVVDYAHTPEALEVALQAARLIAKGEVVVVFGCGGDRDAEKRPAMGALAQRLADRVIVTSDNPRSEDPHQIVSEIIAGLPAGENTSAVSVELDRAKAIDQAVVEAKPGDVVLIAGKGHETTQTIGTEVLAFDDRDVASAALAQREESAA